MIVWKRGCKSFDTLPSRGEVFIPISLLLKSWLLLLNDSSGSVSGTRSEEALLFLPPSLGLIALWECPFRKLLPAAVLWKGQAVWKGLVEVLHWTVPAKLSLESSCPGVGHVSEDISTKLEPSYSSHPDILEQRQAIAAVFCPSSWPTESVSIIKGLLFYTTRILSR